VKRHAAPAQLIAPERRPVEGFAEARLNVRQRSFPRSSGPRWAGRGRLQVLGEAQLKCLRRELGPLAPIKHTTKGARVRATDFLFPLPKSMP
jgi:hypothetical protein